jgi:EAL domain-containing protein (putative c-di-GMP-specific phosphodiesterase class I)
VPAAAATDGGSAPGLASRGGLAAEDIEEASQRDRLRKLRCRFGQRFYFWRPLPAEELGSMLWRSLVA